MMRSRMRRLRLGRADGFTFLELIVATALLMILASAALPLARISIRRQREAELHQDLRDMRLAIDKYKDAGDHTPPLISLLNQGLNSDNYPPDLQTLVDGVQRAGTMTDSKLKFLRR